VEAIMKIKSLLSGLAMAGLVLALGALAAPAAAQTGGVSGKVVDEKGAPAADAEVVLSNPDGITPIKLKTNAKGEYLSIGIRPADYQIKATKGPLSAVIQRTHIGIGSPTEVAVLHLNKGGAASPTNPDEAAALAKKQAEVQAAVKAAQTAFDAGNFDDAIAQYTKIATDVPKCTLCYISIGHAQLKKGDATAAEASFKQAVDLDPTKPDAHAELASLYNTQKKFDDANRESAKANELMAASGSTDPIAIYNQGIILWNQSKAAEAQVQFQKVTELDPKNADAQYFLGMTLVNQGKLPEAKKPFETYMTLAPTGQYADQVKGLLQVIK
jgi:tetratricopeptide (TPR) repeat protein